MEQILITTTWAIIFKYDVIFVSDSEPAFIKIYYLLYIRYIKIYYYLLVFTYRSSAIFTGSFFLKVFISLFISCLVPWLSLGLFSFQFIFFRYFFLFILIYRLTFRLSSPKNDFYYRFFKKHSFSNLDSFHIFAYCSDVIKGDLSTKKRKELFR